ncbi:hypothetical protein SAMN05421693_1354 [Ectothiorhodospira magna]|uniref:Lipoprotein n=2 Tax=Ectothiorhodospira magna TaxID=867345 RepID=A0A1H9GC87_9GAMM|nr:hypothetical protein SAMN05421693_1354 [Ectothiorhodospira magna]
MKKIKTIFLLIVIFSLSACIGGSGGSGGKEDSSEELVYSVAGAWSPEPGLVFNFEMLGIDSDGINYQGRMMRANRDSIMHSGMLVVPVESLIDIYDQFGYRDIINTMTYMDYHGHMIYFEDLSTSTRCVPVSPYKLPDVMRIGDFGRNNDIECTDGTWIESRWWLERDSGQRARLVELQLIRDTFSHQVFSSSEASTVIDKNGNIYSVEMKIDLPDYGYWIKLWSNN